jgi:hypothetical protein
MLFVHLVQLDYDLIYMIRNACMVSNLSSVALDVIEVDIASTGSAINRSIVILSRQLVLI